MLINYKRHYVITV